MGGSAAGAADFLNRLAQAEARDASSLEGPTPSPTSPKGSPKGPRVRHLSIGELTIERPSVGRAIEDLTLAEEERTSSTSPAVKRLSSSSTSPAVACPSLTTAADTAIPIPPPLPVRRGGVGPPRLASESPPEAGSLTSRLHGGVTRALARAPQQEPLRCRRRWQRIYPPPTLRSRWPPGAAARPWQTKWQPSAVEQSRRGDDDVKLEEELVTKYATEEGEPELPQWVPQWGAARKTERLLRARQAKAEAEKASTAAKGLAAEEGLRVFIEYDASRSASPVMRAVMALRQRLYGPNTAPNTSTIPW